VIKENDDKAHEEKVKARKEAKAFVSLRRRIGLNCTNKARDY
jgi:hypothetical protein